MDKAAEDMVIDLARKLYRDWEARHGDPYGSAEPDPLRSSPAHSVRCVGAPWHVKLKGRIREMRERRRYTRRQY